MSADDKNPASDGATSKPEPTGQKEPVTIDLAAVPDKDGRPPSDQTPLGGTPSGTGEPADDGGPPPVAGPGTGGGGSRGIMPLILAGIVGGIIATVLGIAYHASGIVPSRSERLAQQALTGIDDLTASMDKRLSALEARLGETDVSALGDRIAGLETLAADNKDRIAKIEAAPAAGGGSGEGANALAATLQSVEARLTRVEAESAKTAAAVAEVSGLSDRVTTLDASIKSLGERLDTLAERPDPGAESERVARAVAIGMLQQAAGRGGPFAADLAMLKSLDPDQAELDELEPLSTRDTPSVASLQAAFPEVADAILIATSDVDPDAGFFEQLGTLGRGLVSVRPTTAIEGDTPAAIVSRMQAAVDSGDLAKALTEREALPAEGQQASSAWASAAGDRMKIDELVGKLALSVTAPGSN